MKSILFIVLIILVNISFGQTEKCLSLWPQPNCEDLRPIGREVFLIYDGVTGECIGYDVFLLKDYTGLAYQCFDNGKVKYVAFYVNGEQNGPTRIYTSKGFIEEFYKNGKIEWTKCYDENAKEMKCKD